MPKMFYIPVKILEQNGIVPAIDKQHKVMQVRQGGSLHQMLMTQGVMDYQGNILRRSYWGTKSIESIFAYGEWFLRLLRNHNYCLRHNLHATHLHLFFQVDGVYKHTASDFTNN